MSIADPAGTDVPAPTLAAAAPAPGDPVLNIVVFTAFILFAFVLVMRVRRRSGAATADYYTAGSRFTGAENGLALSGDFLSAATFLGIVGAVAVAGPDGYVYAVVAFVAWLVALFFVAELLRNTGRYTMADVLGYRLRKRPVRAAAATSAVVISTLYLLGQLAGAGGLIALLLNITDRAAQSAVIAGVGAVVVAYVLVGGMSGTTWIQIVKACLLLVTGLVMAAFVLGTSGLSLPALLSAAVANHPGGEAVLQPGLLYGGSLTANLDLVSLALGGVLGVAGLPHIMMRFYTVPDARQARRSVVWAIWLIGAFFLLVLVLGYGATALVGPQAIMAAPGGVNSAAPLLALQIGGPVLLALVSAVAFATILAVVAGLMITAAAAFAHDVYAQLMRNGRATAEEEVRVARRTTLVIGVVGIAGGILANGQNIAFLAALTFAMAASANLPTLLYSLFWRRFTTTGAVWSIYGGLTVTLTLIVFSPAVSGTPESMLPGLDFAWFPLSNPGLVSVPAGFLLGYLGSVLGRERPDDAGYAQISVRALTGAGLQRRVTGDPAAPPPLGRHRTGAPGRAPGSAPGRAPGRVAGPVPSPAAGTPGRGPASQPGGPVPAGPRGPVGVAGDPGRPGPPDAALRLGRNRPYRPGDAAGPGGPRR
ncbi:cation/acetate symporter [Pseudonocardia ammonioxydans]|uniref:Cation/acetate symporter n=1 Tax=Pseudonocardia ammonioxydans TaxID=260086 RepID=A0A1I4VY75_PSUAM|nr:cation/acetate symporter [Pseudonocardia ammonioxydans]